MISYPVKLFLDLVKSAGTGASVIGDLFLNSKSKGFSKPNEGNDFYFYERTFDRWRTKPRVIHDRRLRMAYERGTSPQDLAIRNDEEFRLTEDNKTKESQRYHSIHPSLTEDYQLGEGEKPVPNLDETHIEYDPLRGPAAKSIRPTPFRTKDWRGVCPDGEPRPMGRSSGCSGHQANSWDGIIDVNNEPGWADYPNYADFTGLDIRPEDEKEEPMEPGIQGVHPKSWMPRCPDGTEKNPNDTCAGREGWLPWTEEMRRQDDMLLEPRDRETEIDPNPGHGPMRGRYPTNKSIRPTPFRKALDRQGGEVPPPNEMQAAKEFDFITLPKDVRGTNCKNCSWVRGNKCGHPKLKGLPVNEHNCCALWNNPKALRAWENGKTHPATEILHPDIDEYRTLETFDSPIGKALHKAMSAFNALTGGALVGGPEEWGGPRPRKRKEFLARVKALPPQSNGHDMVLAIDVDDTLCETPPHDGPPAPMMELVPREGAVEAMQYFHDTGWHLVIWTCRADQEEVEEWLKHHGIPFDEFNHYSKQPTRSPKVMAHRYIDDRGISAQQPWSDIVKEVDASREIHQPVSSWEELIELGEQSHSELEELLSTFGLPIVPLEELESHIDEPGGLVVLAPLKDQARAQEKVEADYDGDYSRLLDVVRGTVAMDSLEEVYQAVEGLDADVVRKKDRFKNPLPCGYKDVLVNLRLPGGMIAEVQFHLKPMLKTRERVKVVSEPVIREVQSAIHDEHRDHMSPEEIEAVQRAMAISRSMFDQAWQEAAGINKTFPKLYFIKAEAPFTGEFIDSLGRRVCIAGGRRIACGERSFDPGQAAGQQQQVGFGNAQQVQQMPVEEEGVEPIENEPSAKGDKILFAVIFNDEGKMLVRDQDPWGEFVWSAKKQGFIQNLEKMTGLNLRTSGSVGAPEDGQGYFILQVKNKKEGNDASSTMPPPQVQWLSPNEVLQRIHQIGNPDWDQKGSSILKTLVAAWKKKATKKPEVRKSPYGKHFTKTAQATPKYTASIQDAAGRHNCFKGGKRVPCEEFGGEGEGWTNLRENEDLYDALRRLIDEVKTGSEDGWHELVGLLVHTPPEDLAKLKEEHGLSAPQGAKEAILQRVQEELQHVGHQVEEGGEEGV